MVHSSLRHSPMTGSADNGRRGVEGSVQEAVEDICQQNDNRSISFSKKYIGDKTDNDDKKRKSCKCEAEERVPLNQNEFHDVCQYVPSGRQAIYRCSCSSNHLQKYLKRLLPVLSWLPKYDFRNDFMADIVAGITLAIVQIPQAMAFAMLSNASPVLGLYGTFFASAVYFFFGTSNFSSLGMAGVTSLVVGEAINEQLNRLQETNGSNDTLSDNIVSGDNHTVIDTELFKTQIATTMALTVGVLQVTMGLLNLGSLSILFSDVMMRACTMAAVTQMIISQMPHLLGIQINRQAGPLSTVYNVIDLTTEIHRTNFATLITSIISLVFLIAINEGLNSRFKHKLKIPIPTEIILIAFGTAISYYVGLHSNFSVNILNHIPTGLPIPTAPRLDLVPTLMMHSITVTVLTFTIIMSQAKVLSSKYDCFPDISQELFANGVANILGSFFSSLPCSFAFVRCMLLIHLKAKSLLCSLVCAAVLLLALLYIAPIFEPLPQCILAAILVFALSEILLDLKLIPKTWKSVRTDSFVIIFSYFGVLLLDLQFGMTIGIVTSMLMVLFNSIKINISTLGSIYGTDIYLDVNKFKKAKELQNIKIFHIGGSLFFGTKEALKTQIDKSVISLEQKNIMINENHNTLDNMNEEENDLKSVVIIEKPKRIQRKYVILDFAAVTFIDTSALRTMAVIKDELDKVNVQLYIAACSSNVLRTIQASKIFNEADGLFYPTIHDAVLAAKLQQALLPKKTPITTEGYDNPSFVDT